MDQVPSVFCDVLGKYFYNKQFSGEVVRRVWSVTERRLWELGEEGAWEDVYREAAGAGDQETG